MPRSVDTSVEVSGLFDLLRLSLHHLLLVREKRILANQRG